METADLLFHPVRMRIVQTLSGADELTTSQLRDRLPDVAPATLYRHVAALADGAVLEVTGEKRVRGAVERSYRLREENAVVGPGAVMTREDHRRAFALFCASLMADFDRYLSRDGADPAADGVAYRQAGVWLSEEEADALIEEITAMVTERARNNAPDDGRARRYVSLVVVPDDVFDDAERRLAPVLVQAAKDLADGRLADPGLSPAMLARELNVSVRTLQRAFAVTGEPAAAWVRRRRLEEARLALIAPSGRPSISELAAHWQFADSSHFIRAFKEQYGRTPTDYVGTTGPA